MTVQDAISTTRQDANEAQQGVRRRGLIAGAAALAATLVAARTERVGATDGGNLILGSVGDGNNQTTTTTTLTSTTHSGPSLRVTANVFGVSDTQNDAIQAVTTGAISAGVLGRNNDLNGVGIWGAAPNGTGAFGDSNAGSGVAGRSNSGAGVYGQSTTGTGVFGQSNSASALYGQSATNFGMYALSIAGTGAMGQSTSGHGVVGLSGAADGHAGVRGNTTSASGIAVLAEAPAGATALLAHGKTAVNGDFVTFGGIKSAAVPFPDGSLHLLYCMESPESWFEDLGEAKLDHGRADVRLDPNFVAVTDTSHYLVFVTPYFLEGHDLAVTERRADGFVVAERGQGAASGTFAWRVVAKRKDVKAPRFAKFDPPPAPAPLPEPPTLKPPTLPQRPGPTAGQ